MTAPAPHPTASPAGEGKLRASPEMIAAAWSAFRAGRPGRILGPGSGFVEALNAALAVSPYAAFADQLAAAGQERDALRSRCVTLEAALKPARAYFDGYVQDEADDRDCCIDQQQHEAAQAFREAVTSLQGDLA